MSGLKNLKALEDYLLEESLLYGAEQNICNLAFRKCGKIKMYDGKEVDPDEIIYVVKKALSFLMNQYTKTFAFAEKTMNIIYLAHSNEIKTMAVDRHMHLYMNAEFVYGVLKMDPDLIAAVIMHEILHAVYNHLERGKNWLGSKGKPKTPQNWHDTNLAADVEVNRMLVKIACIDEDRLVNEIHGLYLKHEYGYTDVVPMEVILNNEEYMQKLRQMCPPPPEPGETPPDEEKKIKTTEEWNKGYKEAWNKIAELVKKYGAEGTWDVLLKAGLVNAVGEIFLDKDIDDIKTLEFKQVKSIEEYINESLKQNENDKGQTYEDGYITAFGKLVSSIYKAINPSDDDDSLEGGGGGGGEKYDTDLDEDELEEINLPGKKKKGQGGGDDGLPNKLTQDGDSDGSSSSKQSKSYGKGGQGKSSDELSDDEINDLANDLKKKQSSGQKTSTTQEISIGGTGSFIEDGIADKVLKEAGYSEESIKEINKVREKNKEKNSEAKLTKEREGVKRALRARKIPNDAFTQLFDAVEIQEAKYKDLWRKILEQFMSKNTRRAGRGTKTGHNNWKNDRRIALGDYGINRDRECLDPQDTNIYVDVSGSMDRELLEIICKSLVVLAEEWEYSGINVLPWASTFEELTPIHDFYELKKEEIVEQILTAISKGRAMCGGGTDASAVMDAILAAITESLKDESKESKDDVHVVITDGWFDFQNIESRIKSEVRKEFGRPDVTNEVAKHIFWLIYDADDQHMEDWKKEIQEGKIVFINSTFVKNNG